MAYSDRDCFARSTGVLLKAEQTSIFSGCVFAVLSIARVVRSSARVVYANRVWHADAAAAPSTSTSRV
eukprot:6180794-Pleurochrysis_carterae.AAC.1